MFAFFLCLDFLPFKYVEAFHKDSLIEEETRDAISLLRTIDNLSQNSTKDELNRVFETANIDSSFPLSILTPAQLEEQYPQAESGFDENRFFWLNLDDEEYLYKMENQPLILKLGPLATIDEIDELDTLYYYASGILLAIVIFIWQIILWKKLAGLEKQVVKFGDGDLFARASEKPGRRIGKLNTVFNSMAEKTGQLILQNKQLIRAVSHELRAPISRLRCQFDLLDADKSRSSNAAYLNDMSEDITELENLVDEILNYSRLEASDGVAGNMKEQTLRPVLEELLNTMNREFGKEISLDCDPGVCAKMDETHVRRAVGNLIQNAARYCKESVEVSVDVDSKHRSIFIHVDDDGPGIPASERARIFEPFARLDKSRTRDSGGYGLGLAIVNQIAQLHGGEVLVTTSPLQGSRFSLVLPECSG